MMEPNEEQLNAALNGNEDDPQPQDDPQDPQPQDDDPQSDPKPEPVNTEPEDDPAEARATFKSREHRLANERNQARQDAERLRLHNEFLMRQLQTQQNPQPQPQEELDPLQRWQRETNQVLQRNQQITMDLADQAKFNLMLAKRSELTAYADEVEHRLQQFRQQGGNPTREQVLTVIVGERAMDRMTKAPAARKQAAERVKQATGKPLGSPSSVAASKQEPTLFERLKDQPL